MAQEGPKGGTENGGVVGKTETAAFPYLENVSKDESISRLVKIYLTKVRTTVGKKNKEAK